MDRGERERLQRDLTRLAEGDRSAFEPVFAAASPVVLRFARRMAGDGLDADDVAQAALLAVFARELRHALAHALGELGEADAETLRASLRDERPGGVAPATFRKRVSRAIDRLRHAFRRRHGAD